MNWVARLHCFPTKIIQLKSLHICQNNNLISVLYMCYYIYFSCLHYTGMEYIYIYTNPPLLIADMTTWAIQTLLLAMSRSCYEDLFHGNGLCVFQKIKKTIQTVIRSESQAQSWYEVVSVPLANVIYTSVMAALVQKRSIRS